MKVVVTLQCSYGGLEGSFEAKKQFRLEALPQKDSCVVFHGFPNAECRIVDITYWYGDRKLEYVHLIVDCEQPVSQADKEFLEATGWEVGNFVTPGV